MLRLDYKPEDVPREIYQWMLAVQKGLIRIDSMHSDTDAEVKMSCGELTKPIETTVTIKFTSFMGEVCTNASH